MKPSDLARCLPLGPNPPREVRTYIAIAIGYMAEHFRDLTLESGHYPHDVTEYQKLLRQVTEEITLAESRLLVDATSETQAAAPPRRLRLDGSTSSRFLNYCNSCSHVHLGEDECGVDMGPKAGKCGCRMAVPA